METLVYSSTYAAFATPLTLKLGAYLLTPDPAIENVTVRCPLQNTLEASKPTRAIGSIANTCLKTAQLAKSAKGRRRTAYPTIVGMTTHWPGFCRCATFLNRDTGMWEPIIETRSSHSSSKIAVLGYGDQLPADHTTLLQEAEEEFDSLMNEIEPAPAPLFDCTRFGCS
jgi:hypothetical protein